MGNRPKQVSVRWGGDSSQTFLIRATRARKWVFLVHMACENKCEITKSAVVCVAVRRWSYRRSREADMAWALRVCGASSVYHRIKLYKCMPEM